MRAFSYHPAYYHFDGGALNFFERGPQNSRGFRALKVWLALKQVGREGALAMIADDIALSRRLDDLVRKHPDFEPFTQALSITTFRFVPKDLRAGIGAPDVEKRLDAINQALLTRLETSGEAFLSNAIVDGKLALRACIVNFRTSQADIDALPDLIARLGRAVVEDGVAQG